MLFRQLHLHTAHLRELTDFYGRVLGFECAAGDDLLTIKAGKTNLEFLPGREDCYYHFAFNIAPNKIHDCLKWLSLRSKVLPHEGKSIVHFEAWKADAVYTLDTAGNVVEFIARKSLPPSYTLGFDPKQDVLSVSEIGCPVRSISAFRDTVARAGVPIYSGGLRSFCALGDAVGLFIAVDHEKKWWMPTQIEAKAYPFSLWFVQGENEYKMEFGDRVIIERSGPFTTPPSK